MKNAFLKIQFLGEKGNTAGLGAKVKVFQQSGNQYLEQNMYHGFQSSVSPILHIGLGQSFVRLASRDPRPPAIKTT